MFDLKFYFRAVTGKPSLIRLSETLHSFIGSTAPCNVLYSYVNSILRSSNDSQVGYLIFSAASIFLILNSVSILWWRSSYQSQFTLLRTRLISFTESVRLPWLRTSSSSELYSSKTFRSKSCAFICLRIFFSSFCLQIFQIEMNSSRGFSSTQRL